MAVSVVFAGSRALGPSWSPLVAGVVGRCVTAGAPFFAVGCAVGGDLLALSALVAAGAASRVAVFAVGSSAGAGFWSGSSLAGVRSAVAAGARVAWLAGGPLSLPLVPRLAARSRACVASVPGAGVFCAFLASPSSAGSLGAARFALLRGLSVVVFACGFSPSLLPSLGAGSWAPAPVGSAFVGGFVWRPLVAPAPRQLALF